MLKKDMVARIEELEAQVAAASCGGDAVEGSLPWALTEMLAGNTVHDGVRALAIRNSSIFSMTHSRGIESNYQLTFDDIHSTGWKRFDT